MKQEISVVPWHRPRRWQVLLCYALPLLALGWVYSGIDAGAYIFFRNWLRAGCGPVVSLMRSAGFDPNDLTTYAVAFALLWSMWLLAILATPLRRLPLIVHATLGIAWCFGGCVLTLAI
jgi:hypothetical protein